MPLLGMDTRPLAAPPFRRLWASTIVTSLGSQLTAVSVPIQLYSLANSSFYIGLSGALAVAPLILFGLLGGAIADVVDRDQSRHRGASRRRVHGEEAHLDDQ